ncbi:hypothetical protein EPIR_1766 [Erwinia piriflorinigrans CFBP 5888]|uniref:Uncharacterized protein n=1 Tax=Erwinia piriflorinigrans CFBP 5888 TaxID=1161919 RepID=V5Z7W3_9GAMM|nr:hypothetical protein EPIR_1766 [Erwinia piriflorinigrans CFBP 5888]
MLLLASLCCYWQQARRDPTQLILPPLFCQVSR